LNDFAVDKIPAQLDDLAWATQWRQLLVVHRGLNPCAVAGAQDD
jgi:hypothetical protein